MRAGVFAVFLAHFMLTVTAVMLNYLARQKSHICLCASTQGETWPIPCTPSRRTSALQICVNRRRNCLNRRIPDADNKIYPTLGGPSTIKLPRRLYHDLIEFVLRVVCRLGSSVGSTVPVNKASKGLVRADIDQPPLATKFNDIGCCFFCGQCNGGDQYL